MSPQPWAGSLVNMGFHLDRMEKSSQGMWIQLPAVPSSDPKTDTFAQGLMRFWCMLILGLCPTWLRLSPDHTPSLMPTRMSILLSSEDRLFTLVNKLWIETSVCKDSYEWHYVMYIHWNSRTSIAAVWCKVDTLLDEGKYNYNNHLYGKKIINLFYIIL